MGVVLVIYGVKITAEALLMAAAAATAAYTYCKNQPTRLENLKGPTTSELRKRALQYEDDRVKRAADATLKEEKCTCRQLTLNVLYVNIRSMTGSATTAMKRKLELFKKQIKEKEPDIIAITETWLNPAITAEKVAENLGIGDDYHLHRQDRAESHGNAYTDEDSAMKGRRGGGLLIATKKYSLSATRDHNEEFSDYIMTLQVKKWAGDKICLTCKEEIPNSLNGADGWHLGKNWQEVPIAFSLIYHRPIQSKEKKLKEYVEEANKVFDRLTRLPYAHEEEYRGWCLVGDFNMVGADEQNLKEGITQLAQDAEFVPISREATHIKGNRLDWVVASPGLVAGPVEVLDPAVSDHHSLFFQLQLGMGKRSTRLGINCKRAKCVGFDDL